MTITPTSTPSLARSAVRSRLADSSGSSGSSTTVPGAVLDASTPAAAMTNPAGSATIVVGPRRATTRTVSASIASSRVGGDDAALGLADDLRGDHQDVAVPQAGTALGERRVGDQPRHVVARRDLRYPGDTGNVDLCRTGGHRFSSSARSIAPCAIAAAEGRSRMYSGSARTAMPASAGSSAAALSASSTSQPSSSSAP